MTPTKPPLDSKSTKSHSTEITTKYKIIVVGYYAVTIIALLGITLILTGTSCKKRQVESKVSLKTLRLPMEKDETMPSESYHQHRYDATEINALTNIEQDFVILSNPYNLSHEQTVIQWRSAKVSSLKKRVKRFACWHSCFGQFRKKAFRTLYGTIGTSTSNPVGPSPVGPTLSSPGVPTGKNKERKREAVKTTATSQSETGSENNELGEGEEKGLSETAIAHDTTSKLNATTATDFFKLKTKVVEERLQEKTDKTRKVAASTSPASTSPLPNNGKPALHSSPGKAKSETDGNEGRANLKGASKEKSNGKKSPKTAATQPEESDSEEEAEENVEEDGEESQSPEGPDDDGEFSGSNEENEDKGDGIDKKDLEDEE